MQLGILKEAPRESPPSFFAQRSVPQVFVQVLRNGFRQKAAVDFARSKRAQRQEGLQTLQRLKEACSRAAPYQRRRIVIRRLVYELVRRSHNARECFNRGTLLHSSGQHD